MDPNQPLPPSYLDQIAAKPQKKSFLTGNPRVIAIIAGALLLLTIASSITVSLVNNSRKEPWNVLVVRLETAEKVASSASSNLKSSQLRSLNSELKLFLANTNRDLKEPLATLKIDNSTIPKSVIEEESADGILERLESARLNAAYDRTYVREMTYQISQVLLSLQQAYEVSSKVETKDYLDNTYKSLQITHQSLSNYSSTND